METVGPSASDGMLVEFSDNRFLIDLCGAHDENLSKIEDGLGIQIVRRGNRLVLIGDTPGQEAGGRVLKYLYEKLELGRNLEPGDVDSAVRIGRFNVSDPESLSGGLEIKTRRRVVEPRTAGQRDFVQKLLKNELVFGIGPAGTGKTYLAAALAVSMLSDGLVERIVLSRPAVVAGERLGFLPGDIKDKVDPFMQPLYDALRAFLYPKTLNRYLEQGIIEIAPVAFVRGRTLTSSFIVFDEAQNATRMQMKMFLTRLGPGSRMAVTGDVTQIDLPGGVRSGLVEARSILSGVNGVAFTEFSPSEVVRHDLVSRIVEAYGTRSHAAGN